MSTDQAFVAYYVIAGISACCSVFVCFTLLAFASLKSTATQLLLLLHITLLCEELSTLPFVFTSNRGICSAIAFLHFYSGFANAVSIGLLVILFRYHFMEDTFGFTNFIQKYSVYLVSIIPLITLLPFITNSYNNDNDVWCTMETNSVTTNVWAFCTFFVWTWLILVFSTLVLMQTMFKVYSIDKDMGMRIFCTTGMYSIIAILSWVPRTAARFWNGNNENMDRTAFLYSYFPVYISGILYTVVFLREKRAYLLLDRLADWTGTEMDMSVSFSWEDSSASNSLINCSDVVGNRSRTSSANPTNKAVFKPGVYAPLIPRSEVDLEKM